MEYLEIVLKLIIGLGVLNVWLLRANKSSPWRGGEAKTLKEEFATYGLSPAVMKLVGTVKILLALAILASIFFESIEMIGAIGMALMMAGAIAMHIKVSDPLKKSLPALTLFAFSLLLLIL